MTLSTLGVEPNCWSSKLEHETSVGRSSPQKLVLGEKGLKMLLQLATDSISSPWNTSSTMLQPSDCMSQVHVGMTRLHLFSFYSAGRRTKCCRIKVRHVAAIK